MRLTFLSHFVLCLACAAGIFFAWRAGVLQVVWATDQSHMTSVIAAVFVGTMLWIGRQAWRVDGANVSPLTGRVWNRTSESWAPPADVSWGHTASVVLPGLGLFGTTFGLSLEAKSIAASASPMLALGTALYCTAAGVLAMIVVVVATHSLEAGMRRAKR